MIAENIAPAKARLSGLVNAALEIVIKARKGRLQIPGSQPRMWFDAAVAERGLSVIPMTMGIAFRSALLPDFHKNPADRVIIATALQQPLSTT